jgi:hypothetical protein
MGVAKVVLGVLAGGTLGAAIGGRIAIGQQDGWALIVPLGVGGAILGAAIGGGIAALI